MRARRLRSAPSRREAGVRPTPPRSAGRGPGARSAGRARSTSIQSRDLPSGDAVRHQQRIEELVAAAVMAAPQALALEAEVLVEPDRRLVVREHVQLELFHAGLAGPGQGAVEERAA